MKNDESNEEAGEGWGSDFSEDDAAALMDDDDTSWKVRRGANSIVNSIVRTRRDLVSTIHAKYCPALVNCFKERIDDVKIDILDTFMQILDTFDPKSSSQFSISNSSASTPTLTRKDSLQSATE